MPCPRQQKRRAPRITADKRTSFVMSYRPYLDRAALHGSAAIEQMAEDFRIFAANAGSISEADLEVLGWTRAGGGQIGALRLRRAPSRPRPRGWVRRRNGIFRKAT
jgi:hypothetical protein